MRHALLLLQDLAALDRRAAEMRLVLDEIDHGLIIVGLDGVLASERSAAVERLLGPVPASRRIEDYVRAFAPEAADWFGLQWDALRDGVLPAALCLGQLPARFVVAGRHLAFGYKPIASARVLVVVTDVTAEVERQRTARDEREAAALWTRMLSGPIELLALHADIGQAVAAITGGALDERSSIAFRRTVHTLKGLAAHAGLASIAEHCEAIEAALVEADPPAVAAAVRATSARWQAVTGPIAPIVADASSRVEVPAGELDALEAGLRRGAPAGELLRLVERWRLDRIEPRLQRFADDARALALRLGKAPLDVKVEVTGDLRLPGDPWRPFWAAFVHAIRNAIDHGLETAEERAVAGKPEVAVLILRAARRDDGLAIEIEDTGRGVPWAEVAACARRLGLPAHTRDDLAAALFLDGFTTRDTASEVSGRGVGLAALRQACADTGGRVDILSRDGAGTTLAFRWPHLDAPHADEAAAR